MQATICWFDNLLPFTSPWLSGRLFTFCALDVGLKSHQTPALALEKKSLDCWSSPRVQHWLHPLGGHSVYSHRNSLSSFYLLAKSLCTICTIFVVSSSKCFFHCKCAIFRCGKLLVCMWFLCNYPNVQLSGCASILMCAEWAKFRVLLSGVQVPDVLFS